MPAFTLAHLSDLHLGPLPRGALWRNFALKRTVGYLSWRFNRQNIHRPAVVAAIAADVIAATPDHVALTGDIANLSAHEEFSNAARWLQVFGSAGWISFVPGNHDSYVRADWEKGLRHLAAYMSSDMPVSGAVSSRQLAAPFPYVRLRRNIALIGLTSACPQALYRAGGTLGSRQIALASSLLRDLRGKGYFCVVMIHHPPLPGLAKPRKALTDAEAFSEMLSREGAGLVLHGHNHTQMHSVLESRFGPVHVFGVPSASAVPTGHHPPAGWCRYDISRMAGEWRVGITVRTWNDASHRIETTSEFALSLARS